MWKNDKDYKLAKKILFDESCAAVVSEDEIIRLANLFKEIREEGRKEGKKEEYDRLVSCLARKN